MTGGAKLLIVLVVSGAACCMSRMYFLLPNTPSVATAIIHDRLAALSAKTETEYEQGTYQAKCVCEIFVTAIQMRLIL